MRSSLALLALVLACDEPEPQPQPEPENAGYVVHEWGFLAHHFADGQSTTRYVGASPGRFPHSTFGENIGLHGLHGLGAAGGKPILYVHLDEGVDSLDFRASLTIGSDGAFVEHLPPGELNDNTLSWNATARRGTCSAIERYPNRDDPRCSEPRDGYCEAAELGAYETSDAACLKVGDADWNHLFYRAEAPGSLPVRIESTHDGQRIHNDGSTALPSKLIRIRRHDAATDTRVHVFDAPAPGQSIPMPAATESPARDASEQLRTALGALGMTSSETNAFMIAWEAELLGTAADATERAPIQVGSPPRELRPKADALIYFMPQNAVDSLVRLELEPPPREVRRAMLVRIDLNPHPEGTIGLGNLGIQTGYGFNTMSLRGNGPVVRIRSTAPEVTGSLPAEVVRRIIRRHTNEVKRCYEAADSQPNGELEIQLTLTSTGAVRRAAIGKNDLGDEIGRCVVVAARRWRFPAPESGEVEVSQTLTFQMSE